MTHPAGMLILVGISLVGVGLIWLIAPAIPGLGRLPGDIVVERENFRFYFPLATCVVLSLLISAVLWGLRHLGR